MLKLTGFEERQEADEPATLLFPADAVRLLGTATRPAGLGRNREDLMDPIRRAEHALESVESNFARLRAQFNGDDGPRAA